MEPVTRMPPPSANKAAHFGFETQWRRHQKIQNMCPPKNLKKRKIWSLF